MATLDSKIPKGPLKDKWTDYKDHIDLVNPANKRNIDVIVMWNWFSRWFCFCNFSRIRIQRKSICLSRFTS